MLTPEQISAIRAKVLERRAARKEMLSGINPALAGLYESIRRAQIEGRDLSAVKKALSETQLPVPESKAKILPYEAAVKAVGSYPLVPEWIREGFRQGSVGMLAELGGEPLWQRPPEYKPNIIEKIGAGLVSFTPLASPEVLIPGGLARGVGQKIISGGATRAAAGVSRPVVRKGLERAATTGAFLGGYGAMQEPLRKGVTGEDVTVLDVLLGAGKGTITGAAVGLAGAGGGAIGRGGIISKIGELAGEIGGFGTATPVLEGRLPGFEDYVLATGMVLGMRTSSRVAGALWKWASRQNLTPEEQKIVDNISDEQKTEIDKRAREQPYEEWAQIIDEARIERTQAEASEAQRLAGEERVRVGYEQLAEGLPQPPVKLPPLEAPKPAVAPKPEAKPGLTAAEMTEKVLGEKPAKEPKRIKEYWEMTFDEFSRDKYIKREVKPENMREEHKAGVELALQDGETVPSKILADYPDLAAKYGKAKPSGEGEAGFIQLPTKEEFMDAAKRLVFTEAVERPEETFTTIAGVKQEKKLPKSTKLTRSVYISAADIKEAESLAEQLRGHENKLFQELSRGAVRDISLKTMLKKRGKEHISTVVNPEIIRMAKADLDKWKSKQSDIIGKLNLEEDNALRQILTSQRDVVSDEVIKSYARFQESRRVSGLTLKAHQDAMKSFNDYDRFVLNTARFLSRKPLFNDLANNIRTGDYIRAGGNLVDIARLNLFSLMSWQFDFITNAAAGAHKTAGWLAADITDFLSPQSSSHHRIAGLINAVKTGAAFKSGIMPREVDLQLMQSIAGERGLTAPGGALFVYNPYADVALGGAVKLKQFQDYLSKRSFAYASLFNRGASLSQKRGLKGFEKRDFINDFIKSPDTYLSPEGAFAAKMEAVRMGQEAAFDVPLPSAVNKYTQSPVIKTLVSAFPRWSIQFPMWLGRTLGGNPRLWRKIKAGTATSAEIAEQIVGMATGWGGLLLINELFTDDKGEWIVDFDRMELKESRKRLSSLPPIPEALMILCAMKGDLQNAAKAFKYSSIPLADFISGRGGGLLGQMITQGYDVAAGESNIETYSQRLTMTLNRMLPGNSVLNAVESIEDPIQREGFGSFIPTIGKTLPPRVSPTTGEPVVRKQIPPFIGDITGALPTLSGVTLPGWTPELNRIEKAFRELDIDLYPPRRTELAGYEKGKVPNEVWKRYEVLAGQNVQQLITPILDHPSFALLEKDRQRSLLMGARSAARRRAQIQVLTEFQNRKPTQVLPQSPP